MSGVFISDENCVLFDIHSTKDVSSKILEETTSDKLNQRDSYTFIKNQLIALNWKKNKARKFGGNFAENSVVFDEDGQHWQWLAEHPHALFITENLLNERAHWLRQFNAVSLECDSLRGQVNTLTKERDREHELVEGLRAEQQALHSSVLRTNQEHRDVRNHWLSEKADLEGRLFQLQALNTQYQGTLKKRDKEIDRLQQLLAKTVKDSQTKASSSSSAPIVGKEKQTSRGFSIVFATIPLKKNLSQSTGAAPSTSAVLKDAEVLAAKAATKTIAGENDRLRQALEKLQQSISLMQTEFESSLAVAEDNFHRQLEQQRAELVSQQHPAAIPPPSPVPRDDHEDSPSGSPLAISVFTPKCRVAERFIEGLGGLTPVVRPVSWMVGQVNTQVKMLRQRAEEITRSCSKPVSSLTPNYGAVGHRQQHYLQFRLVEALTVIEEQDRLIHEALVGRLYSSSTGFGKDSAVIWEMDEGDNEEINERQELIEDENVSTDTSLLPPASPATIQLLSECGWSVLPAVLLSAGERRTGNYPQKAHVQTDKAAAERLVFLEE